MPWVVALIIWLLGVLSPPVGAEVIPGRQFIDDGSTLTTVGDRDVDIRDDTPHVTLRDSDDDTAVQLHYDSATGTAPWQGLTVWAGTDAGNAFTVGTPRPSLRVDTSGNLYFPFMQSVGAARCLELNVSGQVTLASGDCGTLSGWTDDGTTVRLNTSTDSVGIRNTSPQSVVDILVGAGGPSGLHVGGNFAAGSEGGFYLTGGGSQSILSHNYKLSVAGSIVAANQNNANPAAGIEFLDSGARSDILFRASNVSYTNGQSIGSGPSVAMAILGSGLVGIGTTEPAETLHVVGDVTIRGTNPDLTLAHTGGDTFHLGTEAGSLLFLSNATDGVHYLHISGDHTVDLGRGTIPRLRITTDGTGDGEVELPLDSIGVQELDAIDEPADGESYTFDSATGRGEWVLGTGTNTFSTIAVPAGTNPVADSTTDTLTITEDTFFTITGTAGTDTIAITQVTTDIGTDGLIAADAVALGTDTTGNYAAGDAEAGAALTGDSATSFFSVGTLEVGIGGTGVSSLTDGGILLGSGAGAITALGVATNGQIPIGDGTTDPVLATITGTANQVTVTNGAGTITLSTPQDIATASTPSFTGMALTGDLDIDAANANLTLQHTGADEFGLHTEAGSLLYLQNNTDAVQYWFAGAGHELVYGDVLVPSHNFVTDGTGDGEVVLPNQSIGPAELADNAVTASKLAPGATKSAVVTVTRAALAGMGVQTVTGVGFRGQGLWLNCADAAAQTIGSWGFADQLGTTQSVIYISNGGDYKRATDRIAEQEFTSGSQEVFARFREWTPDGFVLEWVQLGNSNGMDCTALVYGP